MKKIQVTDENIEQKSKLDTTSTKKTSLDSSTKKTSYLPKELKFLRACVEVNAYPRTDDSFSETDASFSQTDDSISIIETSEYTSESSEESKTEESFTSTSSEPSFNQTFVLGQEYPSLSVTEISSSEESQTSKSESSEDKLILPEGWTRFMANGLKTPSGVQYKSVREAIQALVKEEGETPLLEALRGVYVAKGWTSLGKGWLGKNGHKSYDFIAPDGTTFSNKAKAAAYALEHYTRQEEELVKRFNSPMTIKSEQKILAPPLPLGLDDLPGLNVKVIQGNGEDQRHRFAQTIKGAKLEALNSAYKEQNYPNQEQREEIAARLQMPSSVVRNWFQNQRSKDKKLVKQEPPETVEQSAKVMVMVIVDVDMMVI